MTKKESPFARLWASLREYIALNINYAKLTASEKLTLFLAAAACVLSYFVFGTLVFFFMSLAVVEWIGEAIGVAPAYAIMGGFYLLLILVVSLFKKQLIVNPIARFITKLIFH